MKIEEIDTKGYRIEEEGIGRAFIYLIKNDLHDEPYALLEDVFVKKEYRGMGYGTKLIKGAIDLAKEKGAYKIIATSRNEREEVHELYKRLGFKEYGIEFRMDLK